jgi:hypothetical protein
MPLGLRLPTPEPHLNNNLKLTTLYLDNEFLKAIQTPQYHGRSSVL